MSTAAKESRYAAIVTFSLDDVADKLFQEGCEVQGVSYDVHARRFQFTISHPSMKGKREFHVNHCDLPGHYSRRSPFIDRDEIFK